MSRHRILNALTAAVVLTAMTVALAACGGGSESAKSGESPRAVLDEATLRGIDSADVELTLKADAPGREGGNLDVSLSGPFQGEGKSELPQLDMTFEAKGTVEGEPVDSEGGVVVLPNSAYVNYDGTEYEVDPATFGFFESALQEAQREGGSEAGSAGGGCQEELGKLKVGEFLEGGVVNEGSADVEGTTTTKISGDLDVATAIDSLLEVAESPACETQVAAAGPLPSNSEIDEAKEEVKRSLESADVDVYVGDDNIVRQVSARLQIEPKNGGEGPKSAEVSFDLKLKGVNEEQEFSAPEDAEPLSKLFAKLGINPIELFATLQGEGEGLNELLEQLDLPGSVG